MVEERDDGGDGNGDAMPLFDPLCLLLMGCCVAVSGETGDAQEDEEDGKVVMMGVGGMDDESFFSCSCPCPCPCPCPCWSCS